MVCIISSLSLNKLIENFLLQWRNLKMVYFFFFSENPRINILGTTGG